jgi:malate dehydrogenase
VPSVNILGAGELGATLARLLAERELFRCVALVDADVGKARGKALDIAESGPVDHFDVGVDGFATLEAAPQAECWVVADPPELSGPGAAKRVADVARGVAAAAGGAPIVVASAEHGPALVEALAQRVPLPGRVAGSAPLAFAAALRRTLAQGLGVEPRALHAVPIGLPPAHAVVPFGTVLAGGVPVEQLSAVALRRALESLRARVLGPVALAHAAARVASALSGERVALLPVFALLAGQYGHRGVALAVPARLSGGRVEVVESALEPVDRVAFDGAAELRRRAQG